MDLFHFDNPLKMLIAVVPLLLGAPMSAQASTLLLDSFSDDTAGSAPNGVEIGSAIYGGGANVTHSVFDDGGNLRLRVTSPGPSNDSANGSLVEYTPTASASAFRIDYLFRIETGASTAGLNAFQQEVVLSPGGTNLALFWSSAADQHHLWIGSTKPGDSGFALTDTGFQFVLGNDYQISWLVDSVAGLFSLYANGQALTLNQGLPGPAAGLSEVVFSNNFTTTGSQVIDDVRISSVPLPAAFNMFAVGALTLLATIRKRRSAIAV